MKYVYLYANGKAEGDASMKDLLGGKGAGLAEMTNAGLPVPPGFTITTQACMAYYRSGQQFPEGMWQQTLDALKKVEEATGKGFGDRNNPLLVSVRSGAKFSMPGMMDTVLNLGLNEETLQGLAELTGNERFAYDAYRRFINMFGKIVLGVDAERFEHAFEDYKKKVGAVLDTDLDVDSLKQICAEFKQIVKEATGEDFPSDPLQQLERAIRAVFASWNGRRAVDYRRVHKIPDDLGTAVNVVAMVFGNMGNDSGTGVAFTRDPSTGEKVIFGEYLPNAQGEDVVAGIRTPKKISQLQQDMPEVYEQFVKVAEMLERHYKDVQDLEFTIERGKLWMLQTRNAKRTGAAAVRIAVDMVHEGLIDKATAVLRVEPGHLDQLLHPMVDPKAEVKVIATGLPASPGAACGKVVFSPDEAVKMAEAGEKVILVRVETSPDDFHGMVAAQAIVTARGGMTSHAAVVARGMGKCCVVGCGALHIDYASENFSVGEYVINKGDYITVDGSSGRVIFGQVPLVEPKMDEAFAEFMGWVDDFRKLKVRTNADTPNDASVARSFGAEGIGLCRTEHMFFEGDRIDAVREMIVAESKAEREKALAKIEPLQREDFFGIFKAMDGFPVTIRTLDPPLHEFLPRDEAEIEALAAKLHITVAQLKRKIDALHEMNPMLGHRGCRLGILYPEITAMQARAIFEAAVQAKKAGFKVFPEVMIPLVSDVNELRLQAEIVRDVAAKVFAEMGDSVDYLVGTMIELPRAALTADEIAREAEFFSFGTNDLTQTTYGLSRDDSGRFLPFYIEQKIYKEDPFQVLDQTGVGKLIEMAVRLGRSTKPNLKIGICGEHGGEPSSVAFCHRIGLDYVSCSPYRVPIARLAAAQAALGVAKASSQTA
ncbi:MAG: pyruvate, phosphate dikinase [Acidobacteriota bacterium]|nr:pyruvate, phosphate dikinase [Blastocatellia bacterium]MDW8412230.1 pyruvate, phosphate dikinase [Acidobacteriota bacterium]